MKRINLSPMSSLHLAAVTLLTSWLTVPALSQSSDQGVGNQAQGQSPPPIRVGGSAISGLPEDWSHRYVVFSDPGTEQEAIQSGRYEQWQKVVNEPRYVIQQMRRNARVQGPADADVEARSKWISETAGPPPPLEAADESGPPQGFGAHPSRPVRPSPIKADWSVGLGGPGLAAGHYPAKYSLNTNIAECRDFVVFPTGAAGSATQATIVAFDDLYVTGCTQSSPPNPDVFWAFNIGGGTANTSPVVSLDGTQVAFIATISGSANLVILKMGGGGGSLTVPIQPTATGTGGYRTCTPPCYTAISVGAADANSAPFYRYDGTDILYFTDDLGRLYEYSGIFTGNPTQTRIIQGFPGGQPKFNSPVYDSGSKKVFITDSQGYLNSVDTTIASPTTGNGGIVRSNQLNCGTGGFVDPPLVDPSAGTVYAFIGYGCDTGPPANNSYINRFATGSSISSSFGTAFNFGNGGATNPNTTIGNLGAFDNIYLTGTGTGHLYACVNGRIYQLSNPGGSSSTPTIFSTPVSSVSVSSTCSPVTEFLSGGVDRLFVSVQANGNASVTPACTGACVYNYNVTTAPTSGTPTAGLAATGGTSGIVIDNRVSTLTGAQQIYFSTRTTPSNAVQASQSALQ